MQCPRPDEFACLGSAWPESVAQAAASKLNPAWCGPQATWRQRQRFGAWARCLIRLPEAGEDPFQVLLGEAEWQTLLPPAAAGEIVLTALSQETGIYFFPTREWVGRCCRLLQLLKVRRVLEAGAGRGYLAAALAARLATDGLAFLAVDNGQGDFESGLPRHPLVQQGEARAAARTFGPEFILYAWPPPGQSIAPLLASPGVRFVLVVGEAGGGLHRRSGGLAHPTTPGTPFPLPAGLWPLRPESTGRDVVHQGKGTRELCGPPLLTKRRVSAAMPVWKYVRRYLS